MALPDGGWIVSCAGGGEAGADAEVVLGEPWSAGVGVCGLALLVTDGGAVLGRAGELGAICSVVGACAGVDLDCVVGALCSVVGTGAAVVGGAELDGICTVVVTGGATVLGGAVKRGAGCSVWLTGGGAGAVVISTGGWVGTGACGVICGGGVTTGC